MTSKPSGLSRFIAELRRRHVFRGTVAYAAVAFVVLQAAEIVVPAFDIRSWVLQLVVVMAVLGLPVAAALAWVYEITPRGIRTMRAVDAEAGLQPRDVGDLAPRLALLATTLAAVAGAGWWWYRTSVPEPAAADPGATPAFVAPAEDAGDVPIRSLAVLPLDDFSPGGGQDYFAAGMHEALISQLSQLGTVRVISRTSVTSYDGTGKSAVQVGRELGVEGLVEGSVTASGDSVRVTVQLIHAPSDTHLWAGEYDGALEGLLVVQREVARAIASEIEGELGAPEDRPVLAAGDPAPTDPEAAVEEMRGRQILVGGAPEDMEAAESHFEQALREAPGYAPALTSLAGLNLLRGLRAGGDSLPGMDAVDSAEIYVERALESDPDSREARELRALIDGLQRDFRWSFETPPGAVGRHPPPPPDVEVRVFGGDSGTVVVGRDSLVHYVPAVTEIGARVLARIADLQAGMGAAPQRLRAARNLVAVGRRAEAEAVLRTMLEDSPGLAAAWDELEHLLAVRGDLVGVVDLREKRRETVGVETPGAPTVEALEEAVERDGARGYWRWRLRELEARREAGEEVSPVTVAAAHAALGEHEEALGELVRAAETGDPRLATLRTDPVWDPLRDEPRFRQLVRRVVEVRRPDLPGG